MHDAVDAVDDLFDVCHLAEVGGDKFFIGAKIGGRFDVAPADAGIDALEQLAQTRADIAGGAGNENIFHEGCP